MVTGPPLSRAEGSFVGAIASAPVDLFRQHRMHNRWSAEVLR